MKEVNLTLGILIREYREKAALTQKNVADKAGYDSPQFISLIERGISPVPLTLLGTFIKYLNIPEAKVKKLLIDAYTREVEAELEKGKKALK